MGAHRIVAAIDFGTHGTGFAWAFTTEVDRDPRSRRLHYFDSWTDQPQSYPKNLSALLLEADGSVAAWGYEAQKRFLLESRSRPDLQYQHRFKMGLLGDGTDGSEPGTALVLARDNTERLIIDYLRCFHEFAREQIMSSSMVAEDEILWCITVPAIWRDRERQMMRDCAVKAGLPPSRDRLIIALEPEVAALYCHHEAVIEGAGKPGDRFMVVDAGGGTVDITAYEATVDGFTEIGYTSGGSHGSTYIDQYFVSRFLAERIGPDVINRVRDLGPGALAAMFDELERAKANVDPSRGRPLVVQLPPLFYRLLGTDGRERLASMQRGVDDQIVLSTEETVELFEHSVGPIVELVDDQLTRVGQRSVNRVLLVGGFAQSRYLQARLREHLAGRVPLVVPGMPAWAVLLGAVHYALDPAVIRGRRSRYTYGVLVAQPFESGDPENLKLVKYDGTVLCDNRFDVFVAAGDVVDPGHEVRRSYFPIYRDQKDMTVTLYTSTQPQPRYVTDSGCEKVGRMTVDMQATLSLPPKKRQIDVTLLFGGTEIEARASDTQTGSEHRATVRFDRKD